MTVVEIEVFGVSASLDGIARLVSWPYLASRLCPVSAPPAVSRLDFKNTNDAASMKIGPT